MIAVGDCGQDVVGRIERIAHRAKIGLRVLVSVFSAVEVLRLMLLRPSNGSAKPARGRRPQGSA